MKKWLPRLGLVEKGLLAAVMVSLFPLLLLNLQFRNAAAEVTAMEEQVQQAERRVRASQPEDLEALQLKIKGLQERPLAFPRKLDAEAAMVNLWEWAGKERVRLLRINYSFSTTSLGEWQFPQHIFNMEGLGEYEDIVAFVQVLESSPFRVVKLDDWSLVPAGAERWRFVFVMSIWSEGQKTVKPPGGRP